MSKKILLIYTELSFVGSYLVQTPISLVYVASKIVHFPDIEVELVNCQIQNNWHEILHNQLTHEDVLLIGFFMMNRLQITKAHEITQIIKKYNQDVPIIWKKPHPTILPGNVLDYNLIDFYVRGFGIDALTDLVTKLKTEATDYETIPNLCYKNGNVNIIGTINSAYERVSYKDLPYHLLDPFIEKIFTTSKDRTFPIYTAFGCPYLCNFCITPIWFNDTNKK